MSAAGDDGASDDGTDAGSVPQLQRWRLLIAYDGAAFRGFAVQPQVPTVAGALREALGRTARMAEPPVLTCAGRTDAGVHARGQVVHVDLPPVPFDGVGLARAINRQLAPSVVVLSADAVSPDFDARHSATGRTYRYLVWNALAPDPLLAPLTWHIRDPLDLRAMATATDVLLGTHDFRSFCRRKPGTDPGEPIVRRVTAARWSVDQGPEALDAGSGRLLRFEISASSFCHQMVRSLVGSLVEVGRGKGNAATLYDRLRSNTRHLAADPAPADGLCLIRVEYGPRVAFQPAFEATGEVGKGAVGGTAAEGGLPTQSGRPILVRRPTGPPRA